MFNSQNTVYVGSQCKAIEINVKSIEPRQPVDRDAELLAIVRQQHLESLAIIKAEKQAAIDALDGLWSAYLTV